MRKINFRVILTNKSAGNEVRIKAYLTRTAGLVVHREIKWDDLRHKEVIKQGSWNISHYPSGLAAFQQIPTRAEAVSIAENEMGHLNWVGLEGHEAVNANDKTALNAMICAVRIKISDILLLRASRRKK